MASWLENCPLRLQRNLQVLTVHNFGFSFEQVNDIGTHLDSVLQVCQAQPCQCFSLITGDFNFAARDDCSFKIGRPEGDSLPAPICSSGTRQLQWEKHLKLWCEIWQPFPTHYNKVGNSCNRIDRVFSACPRICFLN